jgi:folylpolyglutamate synthase/dihydropteroate synthase
VLVYGTLAGREPQAFLEAVHSDSFAHIVLTQPDSPRAVPATGLLAAVARDGPAATVCPGPGVALRTACKLAGSHGLVLVTGSLSLVAPFAVAARSLQAAALVGRLP